MRSLVPALLPAAATVLAVTTVSVVALPTGVARDGGSTTPVAASLAPPAPAATAVSAPTLHRSGRPPLERSTGPRTAVPAAAPRGRWAWPLAPRPAVTRPFIRPTSTWGAGHRGVDLAAAPSSEVRAVEAGVVSHVGVVAGRGTVTVLHRSGLRSTYEPVDAVVEVGQVVTQGQRLGTLAQGGHCAPAACLHLGALRGATYLDPLTLLGSVRVRLLPMP
ncbi:hypothetical protein GCM10009867_09460 [Pedococcus aerophilus]|uniref:M23ase beta-sheet core domain-containing protein n=1 Tax=Pedococcus aerophilus TaxID=436356 RepID=A0ABN3UHP1_9MICO